MEAFVYVVVLWIGTNYNIIVHPQLFKSYNDCMTFRSVNVDLLERSRPGANARWASRCVSLMTQEV